MKTIKRLLAAAILTLSFGMGTATASVYNLHDYADSTGAVNHVFSVSDIGAFTDTFNFYADDSTLMNWAALAVSVHSGITGFNSVSLTNNDTGNTTTGGTYSYSIFNIADLEIPFGTTGNYSLAIFGTNTVAGSKYSLATSFVTPVPEPSVLAMMLAGLGLVGLVARRSRKA